ncbi:ATP-binding protein [Candidatus Woesearchaeota archaeon]|nr:ATP-binding protein [Candidatus Woesearchaeota archaeon]
MSKENEPKKKEPKDYSRKLAFLQIQPTNFTIRSSKEKEAIIARFQRFLNALDFPIQIFIGTNSLNLDAYINALQMRAETVAQDTKNKLYLKHFESYKKHLLGTIQKKSVLDRSFYIIIPETTSLDVQVSVVLQQLSSLNLAVRRLENDEMMQTLAGCFHDLLQDRTKNPGEQAGPDNSLHALIAPPSLTFRPDHLTIGEKLCRIVAAHGYPRNVEPGFLDKIITLNGIFDLSIFIEPVPIEDMMVILNKELQKQRADLYASELKAIINPTLEIQYSDTRAVLELLQKGHEKLFNVSFYVNCKADSKEELDLITKKVEAELNGMLIIPKLALFQMKEGLKSTIPLADDKLQVKRNVTTRALSAFFPFTSQFLSLDETGVWMGLNKNDVPVIRDIHKLPNPNGMILASSGAGKSYWSKLFIIRQLLNGTKVMLIDPQSEYVKLINTFNGQVINFSRTSSTVINPLDLMGHEYAEKRLMLLDLFGVMLGTLSDIQKSVLDRAITGTYERKGITDNEKTWKNKPPILGDLLAELVSMSKSATIIERETYRSLTNRLSMFVNGVYSFFNRHTKIEFDNSFVGFIIGDMPRQAKPINMFLLLDYVYLKMKTSIERKLLVVDEAWSLLSRAEDSEYLLEIVKTSRKFNLGLLLITQDVTDLLQSRAANAILQNSSYKLLMRQEPAAMENVTKTFNLSETEQELLLTAEVGEGLLLMGNQHTQLRNVASAEEHLLITTNADELLKLPPEKKEEPSESEKPEPARVKQKKEINITLDENKGLFKKSNLSEDEIQFLLKKGYVFSWHVPLGGGRQEIYLIKHSQREGEPHVFLVKSIEEYVRTFTQNVKTFETERPDIVFKAKSKTIGLEIETGNNLRDPSYLEKKIKSLNANYDDWYFVLTDATIAYKYEKMGKTCTRKDVCTIIRNCFKKPV